MKLRMDYNNMMDSRIGAEGISQKDFDAWKPAIERATKTMTEKRPAMTWRELPYNQKEIVADITAYAHEMKNEIDAFVVLGIGGSALGPMAVQQALNHPFYNELPREKRGGFPKLYVVDNVDPERLVYLFETVDPTRCLFNVISKSGSTSETMSQFMIIKALLEEKLGKEKARQHIVCTTDTAKGNLITIAKEENYKYFIIPDGVGGRFSQLCPVGLLPAAFCGIDIAGLLAGAAQMDALCKTDDITKNPAYMFAALHIIALEKGKNITVVMPYADSLKFISDWFAQLWGESLGKHFSLEGKVVNVGQTPVKALGVTDQHSQVQLYTEGPFDKIIVLIGVDTYRETLTIPKLYGDMPSLGFLGGVTHNDLIQTEQAATEYALTKASRMNMTLTLPAVTPQTLGQLLYLFEVATAFAGYLLNIDPFDQPGVEEGKNATYALFGRPGYEAKKAEMDAAPAKDGKYIV
ncbi:MAG: glucose-6-phosphate isomerase [Defluviitaleaceae bacterium]|nr:glucose-6-phosphate isomerase [Defluviitaleaceae bacterium]MCL2238426.1 glucose-6-phosphate isomerase [Defluviitaleaceae bacterium]